MKIIGNISVVSEKRGRLLFTMIVLFSVCGLCLFAKTKANEASGSGYDKWAAIGETAARRSLSMMEKANANPRKEDLIVLTNAGYAEVNGAATQAALDGLASVTGASRGRNTLIEVHSSPWTPLWFAVFDKLSGNCVYLEVDPPAVGKTGMNFKDAPDELFAVSALERVDADHIFQHAGDFKTKFENKVFGGNEFRIITIANAIAKGAPTSLVRALEFHDHFCPGIASGVLMVKFLNENFPAGDSGYFVHTVDPWCKEDTLMVLLNATPGKRNYVLSYPTDADKESRTEDAKKASTIVYRQNMQTKKWEGVILAFGERWPDIGCPKTGSMEMEKLCISMWVLERMDKPEQFVRIIKTFELPEGVSPIEWARPGVDPLVKLGMKK